MILTAATGKDVTTLLGSRDDWQAVIAALESHRASIAIRDRGDVSQVIDHLRRQVADSDRDWPMIALDTDAAVLVRRVVS